MPKATCISAGSTEYVSNPNLVIAYIYADNGKQAAPTVGLRLQPGEDFCVRSPKIKGHIANYPHITGVISPSRERALSKVVLYYKKDSDPSQSTTN